MKNVFMYRDFQEEVYIVLPPGCNMQTKESKHVCKLKKSLYDLEKSHHDFYDLLDIAK